MRIILPSSFPPSIAKELQALEFDILPSDETRLSELLRLSEKERRILFVKAESLPELNADHRNAYGIIALNATAQTPAGFRKSVLPHLRGASEAQFDWHTTFFNGSGGVEITHLVYRNRKLREKVAIPRGSNEQFLHFSGRGVRDLQSRGILLGGFTRTLKGYFVERHPSLFHFHGTVLRGELEVASGDSGFRSLGEGCTFLIPSGTHCAYRAIRSTEFLWFHIQSSAFAPEIEGELRYSDLVHSTDFIDYCRHFKSEARGANAGRTAALGHLAGLIELAIHRSVAALGMHLHLDESRERLKQAFRTIEDNLPANYTVEDLARLAGVSTSRLYRDTRRHFEKSPGALIEEIRIRHARELLLNSNYKLEKIAEMTGYSDAFSFSRAFKRLIGSAPSVFRKGPRSQA